MNNALPRSLCNIQAVPVRASSAALSPRLMHRYARILCTQARRVCVYVYMGGGQAEARDGVSIACGQSVRAPCTWEYICI